MVQAYGYHGCTGYLQLFAVEWKDTKDRVDLYNGGIVTQL